MSTTFPIAFRLVSAGRSTLGCETTSNQRPHIDAVWCNILEKSCALALLVITAPIVGLAGLLIKLTSKGPAVYKQVRVGKDGEVFTIYKLRSMRHLCEKDSGPRWSQHGDLRITPLGRWLRKAHIDELPQFWNVLRGDMALIGPRPERPEISVQLIEVLPQFAERLKVKPGVTGLAQILRPPDVSVQSVRAKLAYDLYFVRVGGWWLRATIILGTILHLAAIRSEIICKWLNLPELDPLDLPNSILSEASPHLSTAT